MCIIKWIGVRCLDYWSVEVVFKGKGQLFFSLGGDSGWIANSLSHCCQIRVLELSNISLKKKKRKKERKCRTRALRKRMCSAHGGS
jgi:hypothetical protein